MTRRRDGGRRRAVRWLAAGLTALLLLVIGTGAVLTLTSPAPRDAPAWRSAAPLPGARGEAAGAVVATADGDRLAVVGGLSGLARTADAVTLYDAARDAWSAAPPLPEPRHHTAAAAVGATLYVTGGAASATDLTTPTPQLWSLDLDDDGGWAEHESLPQPRWGHRMVAVDGRLHVVGGRPGPQVQIHTPGEGWRLGAPIPEVRDHLGVVVHEGEIWAIGGRDESEALTPRVDVYDPEADAWRDGPGLPAPTSAAAVGVVDGRVHVVDGEDPATLGGGVLDAHWVLEPGADRWVSGPPSRLPVHGAADGVLDGRLHVAGGASRQGALSVLSWTAEVQVLGGEAPAAGESRGVTPPVPVARRRPRSGRRGARSGCPASARGRGRSTRSRGPRRRSG